MELNCKAVDKTLSIEATFPKGIEGHMQKLSVNLSYCYTVKHKESNLKSTVSVGCLCPNKNYLNYVQKNNLQ